MNLKDATVSDGVVLADFGTPDPFAPGHLWTGATIRAAELCSWVHLHSDARRIEIRGAHIAQDAKDAPFVDLCDEQIAGALILRNCVISSPLMFDEGELGRLELSDCWLKRGLLLGGVTIRGSLHIHEGSRLGEILGISIHAETAKIDGDVAIRGENTAIEGLRSANGHKYSRRSRHPRRR